MRGLPDAPVRYKQTIRATRPLRFVRWSVRSIADFCFAAGSVTASGICTEEEPHMGDKTIDELRSISRSPLWLCGVAHHLGRGRSATLRKRPASGKAVPYGSAMDVRSL